MPANLDVVYIGMGNSDDHLTQREWHDFVSEARHQIGMAGNILGAWYSEPVAPYQNACFCVELSDQERKYLLRGVLRKLCTRYRQDTISWAPASTEFLQGAGYD